MQSRPRVALGGGLSLAGVAGAVALSGGLAVPVAAAVAAAACCVGLVGGGALSTSERGARLLTHRATAFATGGALVGLGLWVTWTGLQTGGGPRYSVTIGSVFLAVVGWGVFASGRRAGRGEETLAALPRIDPRERAGDERPRWRRVAGNATAVLLVGYFAWRAVTRGEAYSAAFAVLLFALALPGMHYRVELTDGGLVATRYVAWLVPVRRTQTPWVAMYGYEATDERLRIATDYGGDVVYAPGRVEEWDRVVGILDDRLPRL